MPNPFISGLILGFLSCGALWATWKAYGWVVTMWGTINEATEVINQEFNYEPEHKRRIDDAIERTYVGGRRVVIKREHEIRKKKVLEKSFLGAVWNWYAGAWDSKTCEYINPILECHESGNCRFKRRRGN